MSELLRISGRYFCAGVIVGERAAPIIKYMARWERWRIEEYCRRMLWRVEKVHARDGTGEDGSEGGP